MVEFALQGIKTRDFEASNIIHQEKKCLQCQTELSNKKNDYCQECKGL